MTTLERDARPEIQRKRSLPVRLIAFLIGVGVLLVAGWASLALGVRDVSLGDMFAALGGVDETFAQAAVIKRVPRTLMAMLIGAALALAGATMQAITRNPLADPGILGVLSGASLAVVIGMAFFGISSAYPMMILASIGAAAAAVFVYVVGSMGRGGATPLKLALAGAATTAALSSLVSVVLLPRTDLMESFRAWQIGGVGGATWEKLGLLAPVLAIGGIVCLLNARGMNSLALGDELASGLGVHVTRTRILSAFGAVLLCGAATAIVGPIGFVGLVVPHACRMIVGPDHKWLLPYSILAGAILLTVADVVGRLIIPGTEIEVGIITAFIGAPVFIWIVRRYRVREL